MNRLAVGVLLLFVTLLTGVAQGQPINGEAVGSVAATDAGQLPGAEITLRGAGGDRTAIADDEGMWRIENLPPGEYRLFVRLEGFAASTRDVAIREGRTTSIETLLQLAEITEELIVSTGKPIIAGAQNAASNLPPFSPRPGASPGSAINSFGASSGV